MDSETDPHAGQPLVQAGPAPRSAAATLVLVHGRGGDAEDMLDLYAALDLEKLAAVAPQAAENTWYPHSFQAPLSANQPWLDSALGRIKWLVDELISGGVPAHKIALLGFSQGACLVAEFVVRNPRRYGGVMALTGGLIGPPGTERSYIGSLEGTPVFLGTSDPDAHVPVERVEETSQVLTDLGAVVELRRYPGMAHTVNEDELSACRNLLQNLMELPDSTRDEISKPEEKDL